MYCIWGAYNVGTICAVMVGVLMCMNIPYVYYRSHIQHIGRHRTIVPQESHESVVAIADATTQFGTIAYANNTDIATTRTTQVNHTITVIVIRTAGRKDEQIDRYCGVWLKTCRIEKKYLQHSEAVP